MLAFHFPSFLALVDSSKPTVVELYIPELCETQSKGAGPQCTILLLRPTVEFQPISEIKLTIWLVCGRHVNLDKNSAHPEILYLTM